MFFNVYLLLLLCGLAGQVFAAPTIQYAIYPKDGTNAGQVKKITDGLEAVVNKKDIFISASKYLGTFYWWVPLTETQAQKFIQDFHDITATIDPIKAELDQERAVSGMGELVGDLVRDLSSTSQLRKRATAIEFDEDAVDDVKIISQPKGVTLDDLKGYYYDGTAGQKTVVYVVDSGATPDTPDLKNVKLNWIWAGPNPATGMKSDGGGTGHGTCMVSRVAGIVCGSAKKAEITVVRYTDKNGYSNTESAIDGLVKVFDDLEDHQAGKSAVVNMSWDSNVDSKNTDRYDAVKAAYSTLISNLIKNGAICVTSAGNAGVSTPITGLPTLLASTMSGLIVVGGVDDFGTQNPNSQTASYVKVSAPSTGIICASTNKDDPYVGVTGTSGAAASLSGLVANFLTLGKSPSDLPGYLYGLAYPRKANEPDVLYNGIDFRNLGGAKVATTKLTKPTPKTYSFPPGPTFPTTVTAAQPGKATPTTTPTAAAGPKCIHAADPDGAMGLCPSVGATGWCECGPSNYPITAGNNPCGYTGKLPKPTILQSTSCGGSSTAPPPKATTSAPSSPPLICPDGKFYATDTTCGNGECTNAGGNCQCIEAGYEVFNEACTCECKK